MPRLVHKQTQWIRQLLPVCNNDTHFAQRQLGWLKEKVLNDHRGHLLPLSTPVLTAKEEQQLDTYVQQRTENKPLQYILGTQPFCDLDIKTRPPVLIPRWETEEWTYRLIEKIQPWVASQPRPFRILDICTGSGCIALALSAHLAPHKADITALDIGTEAIALAHENYSHVASQLHNPVRFLHKDIFSPQHFAAPFDLIVSNPPYVAEEEYAVLEPDVKAWEDPRALMALENGTAVHQHIIHLAKDLMTPASGTGLPRLLLEIGGTHQVPVLTDRLKTHGFNALSVWKDLAEKDRVMVAY
ncbi:S-adenosyl-L-methionine-dependent methyltransferase [Spinellus fusiger]|nr:S-adenosyl-L-methionine-dependent methyltransferase [Spinellus fusiger]